MDNKLYLETTIHEKYKYEKQKDLKTSRWTVNGNRKGKVYGS